jgi:hypothetical protein
MIVIALLLIAVLVVVKFYGKSSRSESRQEPSEHLKEQFRLFKGEVPKISRYYQQLDLQERELFIRRAWIFFNEKRFEARIIEQVTFRMRTVISCYAAQLTFGLPDIRLVHFKTIIVYPQSYRSTITNQFHKGEANPNGAVIFSWKDLTEGHNAASDGVNLGMHEFAHALRLENVTIDAETDFLDRAALGRFNTLAEREMSRMRMFSNDHFLRAYGAENPQEFFAVCVENFFERPAVFSEQLPDVYDTLTQILQQNPMKNPVRMHN